MYCCLLPLIQKPLKLSEVSYVDILEQSDFSLLNLFYVSGWCKQKVEILSRKICWCSSFINKCQKSCEI
ncbi:unnamed protein product, partial [Brenthis ino]